MTSWGKCCILISLIGPLSAIFWPVRWCGESSCSKALFHHAQCCLQAALCRINNRSLSSSSVSALWFSTSQSFENTHSLVTHFIAGIPFVDSRGEAIHGGTINLTGSAIFINRLENSRHRTYIPLGNILAVPDSGTGAAGHTENHSRNCSEEPKVWCPMEECSQDRACADILAQQPRWRIREDRVQPLHPFAKEVNQEGKTATLRLVVIQEAETPHTRPPNKDETEILTHKSQPHRVRERAIKIPS